MISVRFYVFAAGLVAFSSCMKLPELKENDGAYATPADVQNALLGAWGSQTVDATSINLNEKVFFSKTAQLQGADAKEFEVSKFHVHAVNQRVSGADTLREYRVSFQVLNYADGNSQKPPITTEDGYEFLVPKPGAPSPFIDLQSVDAQALQKLTGQDVHSMDGGKPYLSVHNFFSYLLSCVPNGDWKPRCYNLKSWSTVENAPYFTRKEPTCRGLSNCQINVRHISYDLVTETYDSAKGSTTKLKNILHLQFSPDLPYLSRLVSACFKGVGKYKDQPYVASVCTEVTDYEPGTRP